jgi:hypothetical protein
LASTPAGDSTSARVQPGALSNGEYVINAAAVKAHGVKKLDAINAKGLPKSHVMKRGTPVAAARTLRRPTYFPHPARLAA